MKRKIEMWFFFFKYACIFSSHSYFSRIPVRADFTTLKWNALPQVVGEVTGFCGKWTELCLSFHWPLCRSPAHSPCCWTRAAGEKTLAQQSEPMGISTAFSNCDSGLLPTAFFSHRDYSWLTSKDGFWFAQALCWPVFKMSAFGCETSR